MRTEEWTCLCVGIFVLLAPSSFAQPIVDVRIARFLEGCWEHGNGETREYWIGTGYPLLFGHALTIRDGQLLAFEDLRIEPSAEGVVFVASPNGKGPVRFVAVSQTNNTITFENPTHDYPQVITYARDGDLLVATISATGGKDPIEIPMHRCEV